MKRGDVVLVPFPFQDKLGEKIRPAVVVQSDAETSRLGPDRCAIGDDAVVRKPTLA